MKIPRFEANAQFAWKLLAIEDQFVQTSLKAILPNIIFVSILFVLGVFQLLPFMCRRAAERGLSGGMTIPFIFVLIGFAVFMVGVYEFKLADG